MCFFKIFNCRIIALQYFVGFCCASTWISHRYTYVPSLLNLPPTSHPIPTLFIVTEFLIWPPCILRQISTGSLFLRYMFPCFLSICPTLVFPCCVHKSFLCVCISTVALQTGSSVLSFYIPYTRVNIRYLFFSFWLISLCITGSRFILLIRTENLFFIISVCWLKSVVK